MTAMETADCEDAVSDWLEDTASSDDSSDIASTFVEGGIDINLGWNG